MPGMTQLDQAHVLPRRLQRLQCVRLADGSRVALATSCRARLLGLAGLREPPPAGLLLSRCRAVHTVGMRFPLTLVWLDAGDRIVRVDRGVPPGRLRICARARKVLELPAGQAVLLLDAEPVEQPLVGPPVPLDAD
jgi:uncharacterized membrane protein (UPF0127 family)